MSQREPMSQMVLQKALWVIIGLNLSHASQALTTAIRREGILALACIVEKNERMV